MLSQSVYLDLRHEDPELVNYCDIAGLRFRAFSLERGVVAADRGVPSKQTDRIGDVVSRQQAEDGQCERRSGIPHSAADLRGQTCNLKYTIDDASKE